MTTSGSILRSAFERARFSPNAEPNCAFRFRHFPNLNAECASGSSSVQRPSLLPVSRERRVRHTLPVASAGLLQLDVAIRHAAGAAVPRRAEFVAEAVVFAQVVNVEWLLNILKEDNLADDEKIQELYRSCMALRPKSVKLIDKYTQKRADFETLVRARTIFDRMMEESYARHSGGVCFPTPVPGPGGYLVAAAYRYAKRSSNRGRRWDMGRISAQGQPEPLARKRRGTSRCKVRDRRRTRPSSSQRRLRTDALPGPGVSSSPPPRLRDRHRTLPRRNLSNSPPPRLSLGSKRSPLSSKRKRDLSLSLSNGPSLSPIPSHSHSIPLSKRARRTCGHSAMLRVGRSLWGACISSVFRGLRMRRPAVQAQVQQGQAQVDLQQPQQPLENAFSTCQIDDDDPGYFPDPYARTRRSTRRPCRRSTQDFHAQPAQQYQPTTSPGRSELAHTLGPQPAQQQQQQYQCYSLTDLGLRSRGRDITR
ncbi:hypothetical protein B0H19DRAFT_1236134 [Mycena capillaripes]|nr:hypothetical protein B0H19DRAFT_1236134 [Mycena capillaripes]